MDNLGSPGLAVELEAKVRKVNAVEKSRMVSLGGEDVLANWARNEGAVRHILGKIQFITEPRIAAGHPVRSVSNTGR